MHRADHVVGRLHKLVVDRDTLVAEERHSADWDHDVLIVVVAGRERYYDLDHGVGRNGPGGDHHSLAEELVRKDRAQAEDIDSTRALELRSCNHLCADAMYVNSPDPEGRS